jgi:NADH:ubiquinone reductase (H+-translocating)
MGSTPRIVVVGGGFGGLSAARSLQAADARILLIDKQNHHLFQPLLYQVATAALSPADIAWPIRRILRRQRNAEVLMAEVTGVDPLGKRVLLKDRSEEYDYLVLASGATHSYFGHDEWASHAPGLKEVVDATHIRRRILMAFECAEAVNDSRRRQKFLTFVVVGGGPTGVEMAGTMSELARKALAADFRHIDLRTARVILMEAGPRLLSSFPERLSDYARRALVDLGVDVQLDVAVTGCDADGVDTTSGRIDAATLVWAAGVEASPVARWLDVPADRAGRVTVGEDLSVRGRDGVFVIGDAALYQHGTDKPLPGVAPVAKQQGAFVGAVIACRISGKPKPAAFRYRDAGQLATIGRRAAVVDFGRVRFTGRLAWWFWGIVHIYFLIGVRSRLLVAIQWLWSYLTFDRGARLITPDAQAAVKRRTSPDHP